MDPILKYLLDFNKVNSIEYSSRYLIPPKGLQKMLDSFNGFHLNTEVVIKSERDIIVEPEPKPVESDEDILAKLMEEL